MATYTPKRLSQAVLTTSPIQQYAAPSSGSTIVSEIILANTTGVSVDATVYIVPVGTAVASASASNMLIPGTTIPAYTALPISVAQVLASSDALAAKASVAASITMTASGVEII